MKVLGEGGLCGREGRGNEVSAEMCSSSLGPSDLFLTWWDRPFCRSEDDILLISLFTCSHLQTLPTCVKQSPRTIILRVRNIIA